MGCTLSKDGIQVARLDESTRRREFITKSLNKSFLLSSLLEKLSDDDTVAFLDTAEEIHLNKGQEVVAEGMQFFAIFILHSHFYFQNFQVIFLTIFLSLAMEHFCLKTIKQS